MSRAGMYDHLNATEQPKIEISMDELAVLVESMNYGTIRFLAALMRARKQSKKRLSRDLLMEGIESLLEQGLY